MRYAFVFLSIVAIWASFLALAAKTTANATFLFVVVLVLTVLLFLIGFNKGR